MRNVSDRMMNRRPATLCLHAFYFFDTDLRARRVITVKVRFTLSREYQTSPRDG